jgi:hypothetical protein
MVNYVCIRDLIYSHAVPDILTYYPICMYLCYVTHNSINHLVFNNHSQF